MKNSFLIIALLFSFSAMAKDMSRTEKFNDVYKELEDGSIQYVGRCSLHPDMTDVHFVEKETLVDYFDSDYGRLSREKFLKLTSALEVELIYAAEATASAKMPEGLDDFSADKIESTTFKGLNLYRLNMGVGGGNGKYEVYNRTVVNGKPAYELMAEIMDGDVEYCDSKVWLSK